MYQINDAVIHRSAGAGRVVDICIPDFVKSKERYYKIQPVGEMDGILYVKIENGEEQMRSVITESEAGEYLEHLSEMESRYSDNDKAREKEFKEMIRSCECKQWLEMLKGILNERARRIAAGRKLSMNDEKNLQKVEKLIAGEFAVVFNISLEQAKGKIVSALC